MEQYITNLKKTVRNVIEKVEVNRSSILLLTASRLGGIYTGQEGHVLCQHSI